MCASALARSVTVSGPVPQHTRESTWCEMEDRAITVPFKRDKRITRQQGSVRIEGATTSRGLGKSTHAPSPVLRRLDIF
jgi:hypothetical protein